MFNNGNSGLSASDVLALSNNDGIGGNGSWLWLIVIIALFGGFGGYGFGGGQGAMQNYVLGSDFATIQRQLSDGFNSIDNALDAQNNGICNLGYTQLQLANQLGTTVMQGNNAIQSQLADCCCKTQQNIKDTQYAIATTGAGITNAIKDCCCDAERTAMQAEYNAQARNCQTLQAIDKLGDRLENKFDNYITQQLRDENFALKLASSQSMQNNYLISKLAPTPVPAFNVGYNPYNYGYGFGFNGTTIA